MDDNTKQASSYQHDQETLDARGIRMTVYEVTRLPTSKYLEKVQSLNLREDDLMFLKGLRRRIRNRLASQNSRRRSVENLRRLTRELRAVRACRDDALAERRVLLATRTVLRTRYTSLRTHIMTVLEERSDPTKVPELEPEIVIESPRTDIFPCLKSQIFECRIDKLVQQSVNHIYKEKSIETNSDENKLEKPNIGNCKLNNDNIKREFDNFKSNNDNSTWDNDHHKVDKPKNDSNKRENDNFKSCNDCVLDVSNDNWENDLKMDTDICEQNIYDENEIYTMEKHDNSFKLYKTDMYMMEKRENAGESEAFKPKQMVCAKTVFIDGVLNLSKRKSHGRKQLAPRRIAYVFSEPDNDGVLDLKIKKEPQ
ncbi:unnamed protein product [Leptosia nina]|uniref:BZIP domain-containing protein n=1 Tax=Leptosia nina TaxID=320188 RepID=A0AAV1JUP3_9NEOP